MEIKKVWAVYFSGTGTTKKVTMEIAQEAAKRSGVEFGIFDFSLPETRKEPLCFAEGELVVFGMPVYAGRVPNVLLPYLGTIRGGGAAAIPVVLFGNRNFDDALVELRDVLEADGFRTIAAGAFVGEHSFSEVLAQGRPDEKDLAAAREFAARAMEKAERIEMIEEALPVQVEGVPHPYRGYYQPRDRQGNSIDIRKVKPVTDEQCDGCGICAAICVMGSIQKDDCREVPGVCIKCCACVKECPRKAKRFADEKFLYHQHELEEAFQRRAEPALYF